VKSKAARRIAARICARQFFAYLFLDVIIAVILFGAIVYLFGRAETADTRWFGPFYVDDQVELVVWDFGDTGLFATANPLIWIGYGRFFAAIGIVQVISLISDAFGNAAAARIEMKPLQQIADTARSMQGTAEEKPQQEKPDEGAQLRALHAKLESAVSAYNSQVRFVSDASHELRTPIAVIDGYANMLDRWGSSDRATLEESIAAIRKETGYMKGLIEQLLFLARGDSDTIKIDKANFDLTELAKETVGEFAMIDPDHEFSLRGEAAEVTADRSLVKQMMRILLDNAVKYTDKGGEITVTTAKTQADSRFSVSDSGIGIAPEALSRVFGRFTRADDSRNRETGGAGLGLSIADWIARRHGGSIEVVSRQGIGTRFTVILPDKT